MQCNTPPFARDLGRYMNLYCIVLQYKYNKGVKSYVISVSDSFTLKGGV